MGAADDDVVGVEGSRKSCKRIATKNTVFEIFFCTNYNKNQSRFYIA